MLGKAGSPGVRASKTRNGLGGAIAGALVAGLTLAMSGAFAQQAQQTPAQTKPQITRQATTKITPQPEAQIAQPPPAQITQQPQFTRVPPASITKPPSTTKPPQPTKPPQVATQPQTQVKRPGVDLTRVPAAEITPQPVSTGIVVATVTQAEVALNTAVSTYRPNDPGRPEIRVVAGKGYEEAYKIFCTPRGADIMALIDRLSETMLQACKRSRPNLYAMQIGSKSVVVHWLYLDGSNQKPDVGPLAKHIAGYAPPQPARDPPPQTTTKPPVRPPAADQRPTQVTTKPPARQPPKTTPPPKTKPVADPKPPPQVAVAPPQRSTKPDPTPKPTPVADPGPPPKADPPLSQAADPTSAPQPSVPTDAPSDPPASTDQVTPAVPTAPIEPVKPAGLPEETKWVLPIGGLVFVLAALAAFVRPRPRARAPRESREDSRKPPPAPQLSAHIVGNRLNGEGVSIPPANGKEIELRFSVMGGDGPDIQITPDGSRNG